MPPLIAAAIVFFASGSILVLEILAGRILAPYVGVTLQTYTGIIGTVLAGISLGNWYGGRLADRVDPRRLLGPALLLGGILALLSIPLITFFGELLRGGGNAAILLLSLLGFFAPAAVLATVTPTVVKLQLHSLEETGTIVGKLSAIATAGAIVGTFLTGFLLVAAFPSRPIVLGVGGALVLLGVWLWVALHPGGQRQLTSFTAVAVGAASLTLFAVGPCDRETAYYCARVLADEDRDRGRVLVLDTLRHSYVDLEDPAYLDFRYMQLFGAAVDAHAPEGEALDVLHIGGAGFTMPRWVSETRPGSHNVVLELDPELVDFAEDELGLDPDADGLDIVLGDARMTLGQQPRGEFDVVIGDAFGGLAVPWHLTTREFAEEVRARVVDDGLYVINVIDYPPLEFARAKAATLAEIFEHVAVVAEPDRLARQDGGNIILLGSDVPLAAEELERALADGGGERVVTGEELAAFVGDAPVLTDEFAPVDQLLTVPRPAAGPG